MQTNSTRILQVEIHYCYTYKDLEYFLIRKLTFVLLSDNVAVYLLQDDSKLGCLACLPPHRPG